MNKSNLPTERIVWIGRSATRAEALITALNKLGYKSIAYPAIQIINDTENNAFQAFISNPQQYSLCIFVSAEAAKRCVAALSKHTSLPPALAIGKTSAQELAGVFQLAEEAETMGDSKSLLNTTTLKNIAGKKIAVLGGTTDNQNNSLSPFLCSALTAGGAFVFPIPVYRRRPIPPDGKLQNLLTNGDLIATVAYSGDTVRQMKIIHPSIIQLPLFVPHPNIVNAALEAGFLRPLLITSTAGEDMAKTIAAVLPKCN